MNDSDRNPAWTDTGGPSGGPEGISGPAPAVDPEMPDPDPPSPVGEEPHEPEEQPGVAGVLDGELHPLDTRFISAERISSWIGSGVVALLTFVGLILNWIFEWSPEWLRWPISGAWFLFACFLALLAHKMPVWEYRHCRYRVSLLGIEIRRGIFWKKVTSVPLSRVQHTDVSQGPLQRHYGIATLTVHTAGTEEASVELAGLSHEDALLVRDFLIRGEDDPHV